MSNNYPSMDRLAELQRLITQFAGIQRMVHLADSGRPENDVEHSFGLALTCWFLAPKIAPQLNLEKILTYSLTHDIVEIHAGDAFVFDKQAVAAKAELEEKALEQLAREWPDFADITEVAAAYKDKRDAEARFVYTIDKILPSLMVNLGEKDAFWKRHKITKEMETQEKMDKMKFSPEAESYLHMLLEWMSNPDYFYKPDASQQG